MFLGVILKQRVFISYTLRDDEISIELLSSLKEILDKHEIDSFIDVIDNNNINTEEHQKKIYNWILTATCLFLIETKETYNSPWVKKELDYANSVNIPIMKMRFRDIKKLIMNPAKIKKFLSINKK